MKVEKARDGLLSDFEVLKHLEDIRESRSIATHSLKPENVETILIEVYAYLRDRPAGNPANPQTAEGIAAFIKAVESYNLEKAEIYQLINCTPRSLPVLFNTIEECDQRLTDEQMDEVLELIAQHLGFEPVPEPEEGQEADNSAPQE